MPSVCLTDSSTPQLRRWPLRNNHTGTHILNYALREVLGDHIDQKGSLVAPSKLRFDFSHKAPVAPSDLEKIEVITNEWIKKNVKVFAQDVDLKTAQQIPGLRAVFGETYPDPVRLVTLEFSVDEILADITNPKWRSTSVEFCGGTSVPFLPRVADRTRVLTESFCRHVAKTSDIKDFVIVEESGIAKGIRRIVAVTGEDARQVSHRANDTEARFEAITKLVGKEKEKALKIYDTVRVPAGCSSSSSPS